MSFQDGPKLREQYWWVWGGALTFVLLKQGQWILVTDKPTAQASVHLKDRFVDLTRITSTKTES